nr:hypothetical protein [Tanacetum cinerariifolium]
MRKYFLPKSNVKNLLKEIDKKLIDVVPKLVTKELDQNMKDNLLWLVVDVIKLEREKSKAELSSMVADVVQKEYEHTIDEFFSKDTNELAANVPQQ